MCVVWLEKRSPPMNVCRNCIRPLHLVVDVGWLHGELPQYAHEPITCENPHPTWCRRRRHEGDCQRSEAAP